MLTRVYGTAGAGGHPLRLWLSAPSDALEPSPGVVFVHSGGWFQGSPEEYTRHCHELASMGFVTATIEYRLHPEGTVYDALADTKCAVRWMRAHAVEIGLDPDRLVIAGGSAGGQLAAMTALTPGRFEGSGGNAGVSSAVSGVVMWYPMIDLRRCEGILRTKIAEIVGEGPDELAQLSPASQVRAGAPPMLTITGDSDSLTPLAMIRDFHETLEAAGVSSSLVVIAGREHAFDQGTGRVESRFRADVGVPGRPVAMMWTLARSMGRAP